MLYGVNECEVGTSRFDRARHDLNFISSTFSKIDPDFNNLSIRDHFRLGKFSPDNKPRPILVKLNRASDVSGILRGRRSLDHGIHIKPDMTPRERFIESLLLKERRSLIELGCDRTSIKISNSKLFLNNQLYGQVVEDGFVKSSGLPDVASLLRDMSVLLSTSVDDMMMKLNLLLLTLIQRQLTND